MLPLIDAVRVQLYNMANSPNIFPFPIVQSTLPFLLTSTWPSVFVRIRNYKTQLRKKFYDHQTIPTFRGVNNMAHVAFLNNSQEARNTRNGKAWSMAKSRWLGGTTWRHVGTEKMRDILDFIILFIEESRQYFEKTRSLTMLCFKKFYWLIVFVIKYIYKNTYKHHSLIVLFCLIC